MAKAWRIWDGDECFACGDDAEVFTDSGQDNFAYDGDEARCVECGLRGNVCVDEDGAYIDWDDGAQLPDTRQPARKRHNVR